MLSLIQICKKTETLHPCIAFQKFSLNFQPNRKLVSDMIASNISIMLEVFHGKIPFAVMHILSVLSWSIENRYIFTGWPVLVGKHLGASKQ